MTPLALNTVYCGDALMFLKTLPSGSVHCAVSSPPYYNLRDYKMPGQIGLEKSPAQYVERLVEVFREVRRVLRKDGTFWLNLGDSYAGGQCGNVPHGDGIKHKDLVGVPWMVAFALRADGWWLRQDIIWAKPNPMPESARDRCTKSHEYIFLFSKSKAYFYDADAVAEPATKTTSGNLARKVRPGAPAAHGGKQAGSAPWTGSVRNKRDVWTVSVKPFRGAHFATFPPDLIEPCILAGTSGGGACADCGMPLSPIYKKGEPDMEHRRAGGGNAIDGGYSGKATKDYLAHGAQNAAAVKARILAGMVKKTLVGWRHACGCRKAVTVPAVVLDPFMGSGTVGMVARRHGRNFLGCELNLEYVDIARRRLAEATLGDLI
jgi:DNA modification methylase